MATNCNWYKKSPGHSDPDFKAKIVKPNVRLIMIESKKSKADIDVRSYKEHFGLCNYDSLFFLLFVVYFSAIMFIFFMWLELFWAWPSYTRIPLKRLPIPIPIHTHMRHLLCSCRLLLRRMLTPKCLFIYFQHRQLSKEQYRPFVPSFVSSYWPRCKGKSSQP